MGEKELQDIVQQFSTNFHTSSIEKKGDSGTVTIPYSIGPYDINQALYDSGEGINVMPLVIYKVLESGELKTIAARLLMVDLSVKKPMGIVINVDVRVASFIYWINFMILDCEVDTHSSIILGRPFLSAGQVLINMDLEEITFKWNSEQILLNICMALQQLNDIGVVAVIDIVDNDVVRVDVLIEKRLGIEALAVVIINFESDRIDEYD
ncbi:uncharacterized protein LOC124886631 [Capsicum annuum]|uniref:uncharacterized protein LOC124886631 n=1 Tax=Capsicum annuum TaxID=4072 RepID=UPI001FB12C4A|nr:uncharacterized protein LOC124886631 [Capsicum annuum]